MRSSLHAPAAVAITLLMALLASAPGALAATQTREEPVMPGQSFELDVELEAGGRSPWRVVVAPAGEEVWLNVHTHVDREVEDFIDLVVNDTEEGVFEAPRSGVYSWWVIGNRSGQSVDVKVTVEGRAVGTEADDDALLGLPGPQPLLAATFAAAVALAMRRRGRRGVP